MEPELKKEKLLWLAGEIHLARRRIREAVFMIENSDDPEFFRSCYRYEVDSFKQYAPFYAYENPEFLAETAQGDRDAVRKAIGFLEADPYCFRSGYIKKKLCTALKKAPLTREERAQLRTVVLERLQTQRPVSFRDIASLGCHLYTPGFHERVRKLEMIPFKYLLARRKRFLALLEAEAKKRQSAKLPARESPDALDPKDTGAVNKNESHSRKIFPLRFLTFFKKSISMLWK